MSQSELIEAIKAHDVELVRLLISNMPIGEINNQRLARVPPLLVACTLTDLTILRMLVALPGIDLYVTDHNIRDISYYLLTYDHQDYFFELIDSIDIDSNNRFIRTMIDLDRIDIIRQLIDRGYTVDVEDVIQAIDMNLFEHYSYLIKHIRLDGFEVGRIMSYIMHDDTLEYFNVLFKHVGNDLAEIIDDYDDHILCELIEYHPHNIPLLIKLIEIGVDIDSQNFEGYTALHMAVEHHQYEIVEVLLDAGADRYIKNDDNLDVIELANLEGYQQIIDLVTNHSLVDVKEPAI